MLAWNRKDCVLEGLERIQESEYKKYEVIVVDNGSTDGTAKAVREFFPTVKVISLPENIGINGYNVGFKEANGKYILCLDDDSYPDPQCLSKIVKKFESEPESTAILTLKIINQYPEGEYCPTTNWPQEMITFWAGAAVIRSDILKRLGGYNPEFFLYRNELELSIRYYIEGYKILYYEEATIIHKTSPLNRTSTRAFRYNYKNDIYIFWNYFPLSTSLNYLSKILLITFLKSIFKYNFSDFLFIWNPFFRRWMWNRKYKKLPNKDIIKYFDQPQWREMNLIQPKLSDIPKRIIKKQTIW
jgi:hypothetical protein